MAGIGHRGFMGRNKAGNFRYLHDEISGGQLAFGRTLQRSAYSGNCYRVGSVEPGTNYGFSNNLYIPSSPDTDRFVFAMYDQMENSDAGPTASGSQTGYSALRNDFQFGRIGYNGQNFYIKRTSTPYTIVYVLKDYGINRPSLFHNGLQSPGNDALFYAPVNTSDLRMWCRSGNNNGTKQIRWDGGWDWVSGEIKIVFLTYDGSRNISGWEIYRNDVTTALTKTTLTNGALSDVEIGENAVDNGSRYYFNQVFDDDGSQMMECHIFNKVLDSTERQTTKEIFEQYYTFT